MGNRESLEKLIQEINNSNLPSLHHLEDCDFFDEADPKLVAEGLGVDKHRWYETTTNVYQVGDLFLGVCGASQLYSESSGWEDLCIETVAFEMKAVQTTTYEKV